MEMIDVLDAEGRKTDIVKSKQDIHRDGDWHSTVHVWIVNSKNQLLLQFRSPEKINYPNMWDISVAGHIDAGETAIDTAIRETQEEIGITLEASDFKHLGTFKEEVLLNNGAFRENQFNEVFLVRKDIDLSDMVVQPGEVAEVRYIDARDFAEWVRAEREDLVPHPEEYSVILEAVG